MDQPTLSFGEGHHADSYIHFNTQLPPEEFIKQTSVDRLEVPDENAGIYQSEQYFLASKNRNMASPLIPDSKQASFKSAGKLRGMLSNKENIPQKERDGSSENRKDQNRFIGDTASFLKVNHPFPQNFAKKPPISSSFHLQKSMNGPSDSFSLSFAQEKKNMENNDNNRTSLQPLTEKVFERNQSQKNFRLDIQTPNFSEPISFPEGTATSAASQSTSLRQDIDQSQSAKGVEDRIQRKEVNKIEAKPLRRKTPKKVEISLAFENTAPKIEPQQKPDEVRISLPKEKQTEQRQSLWESREDNQEELAFRPLSKERKLPSSRSLGRSSAEVLVDPDMTTDKRESHRKRQSLNEEKQGKDNQINTSLPIQVSGQSDQAKENQEKTVYEKLFEMNKSRRVFQKNTSVPGLNDSETFHGGHGSFSTKNGPYSHFFMKDSYSFQPKLESKSKFMKRDEKVDTLLYKDAIRRQNKSMEHIPTTPLTPSKYTLHQSNKLIAKKFVREFEDEAYAFFGFGQEHRFNYSQLTEFLKRLKFVKGFQDSSTHAIYEKTLIDTIWTILKGDKYHGVNERNLLLFLLAVMGLYFDIPGYIPTQNASIAPNVTDKTRMSTQFSTSLAVSEMNPSEKRESLWKKKSESDGTVPLRGSRQAESDYEKESLDANNAKSSSVTSNTATTQPKNHLSVTSDPSDEQEASLGISNILAQKLSFQSDNSKPVEGSGLPEPEESQVLIGAFDDAENISFTEEELQRISQTYDVFYCNRLHASKSRSRKGNQSRLDLSFEPEILDYSRQLASNYREKQLQSLEDIMVDLKGIVPQDKRVTHADLLIYKGLSTKNKLSQQRQKSIEKQLEACTFQPNILASTRTPGKQAIKRDNQSKGEELYNLSKKPNRLKADRSPLDVEYQKGYENCTFKPNLQKSTRSQSRTKKKSLDVSKDFEKSVERIRKGREQRENVRMATEIRAQNHNDKRSQFKFTLEKMNQGKRESMSFVKHQQPDLNSTEGDARYTTSSKRQSSMSFVGKRKDDSSFIGSEARESQQNNNLFHEIERQIYQANVENNNKILNESILNQKSNRLTGHTFDSTVEEQSSLLKKAQEKVPLLYVDVNFGGTKSERILVYDGDTAESLATQFAMRNNLNDHLKTKLTMLLQSHMAGILSKIEEEMPSTQSEIHRVPPSQSGYNKFR